MTSPFHLFGIRHHGPACARSLVAALENMVPDCILIEGPPDAEDTLSLLGEDNLVPPVALLVYAREQMDEASFYPFAQFSPEWQALQYGQSKSIPVRFMDLPHTHRFAMRIEAQKQQEQAPEKCRNEDVQSEQTVLDTGSPETKDLYPDSDSTLHSPPSEPGEKTHSLLYHDPLSWLAQAAGYTDGESWWNQWIEERNHPGDIFAVVSEVMTALRSEQEAMVSRNIFTDEHYKEDDLREAYMRKTMREAEKQGYQRIAVVCGAWHVPALKVFPSAKEDQAKLKNLPKVKVGSVWVPWTYQRLSRQSGYGAGIESPQWYSHLWTHANDEQRSIRWLSKVASLFRQNNLDCSSAHVIESARLAEALAAVRGRHQAGLDELLESVQTVMCMGDSTPLRLVHDALVIGHQMGSIPENAPGVPLQRDLEQQQKSLRLKPEALPKKLDLDLRKPQDIARSELLHRLSLLGIHWGTLSGAGLYYGSARTQGTFHEIWELCWQPELAIRIIEKSAYGRSVEEAAGQYLLSTIAAEEKLATLSSLIEPLLCANLPSAVPVVMARLDTLAAMSSDVIQFMRAISPLVEILRYGNVRQTDGSQLKHILENMVARTVVGLPMACNSLDDAAAVQILKDIRQLNQSLDVLFHEIPALKDDWFHCLGRLSHLGQIHRAISGLASRFLYEAQVIDVEALEVRMQLALSSGQIPEHIAAWLEGFVSDNALVLLHHDGLWGLLDNWLSLVDDAVFQQILPMLRRAFTNFNPNERHQLATRAKARKVVNADYAGISPGSDQFDMARYEKPLPVLARILGRNSEFIR